MKNEEQRGMSGIAQQCFEIFDKSFAKQNMPALSTIHYSLFV